MAYSALRAAALAPVLLASAACAAAQARPAAGAPEGSDVALVVMLTVDQLRGDYLERYRSEFAGGFRRFATDGIVFLDGRQDHAMTETAPGHSTVLSGRPPASTGIISNVRGVPDATHPLVEAPPGFRGASPARFLGTTLADWMLARDPQTRILSASMKDRGAILTVGRGKHQVYWWAGGVFTTSTWYRTALPGWVRTWNAKRGAAALAGAVWEPSADPSAWPEPEVLPYKLSRRDSTFPHRMPSDPAQAERAVMAFPWMDSLTFDFALHGVKALGVGRRGPGRPDLLAVSLSTLDVIGHSFGPDSREVHDHMLRLDQWMGAFLDALRREVPKGRIVVALTGDHGVMPFPETPGPDGQAVGGRAWLGELATGARTVLEPALGVERLDLEFEGGLMLADVALLRERGVDVDSLRAALVAEARTAPGVAKVFAPADLARLAATDDDARLWARTIPEGQGWLFCATPLPGWMWAERGGWTTHGTTHLPDMHVPVAFLVPGRAAAAPTRTVTTEDIGPTLAALIGITPTEPVTGTVLPEVAGP